MLLRSIPDVAFGSKSIVCMYVHTYIEKLRNWLFVVVISRTHKQHVNIYKYKKYFNVSLENEKISMKAWKNEK